MHIFFQCNSLSTESSEKMIKFLNIFNYFNINYLTELKVYNQKWINKKFHSQMNSYTNSKSKRIKYTNESVDDNLQKLENALYEEDIKGLLNLSISEKLILLYNYIVRSCSADNSDTMSNLSTDNLRQNKELIQYILFIYVKIICLLLYKEEQKSVLIHLQELLINISKSPILLPDTIIEIDNLLDNRIVKQSKQSKDLLDSTVLSNKYAINSDLTKECHVEIIETTIKLFPYKNIIIIPTLSNYYNIYMLLFKKHFNISFDILETFKKQLMSLKESNKVLYEGWLLLAYAYYRLYSYKKSKKILKYCQNILYLQKRKNLENSDINNYKLNYFDTIVLMLQGCCYYSVVSVINDKKNKKTKKN